MVDINIEKILDILNANIENNKITTEQLDHDLSLFGIDSILFIQIIISLEEEFECTIPDSKLLFEEMNTVNKIFNILNSFASIY